jgi:uncharacterized protein (DUF983 family)
MPESQAFCPRCKQQTVFLTTGRVNTCSVCGFQYESMDPRVAAESGDGWGFLSALGKALLLLAAVAVVCLAVWFAGCAIALGNL